MQWTKDGVGIVSDIVFGAAGGVIAGKVAKGKDVEQTSTSSPSQSLEELTKPYDPKQSAY
ncbi:hypothetical protein [uncultured Acinetobacter sp.]|uniref:hypothetical protein n=1 Tax=uncultured Acinetobacter sp. TaxID=165433 RepID=UPI00258B7456|nr:hypothetical protein [uncultured Acinetobacter sp.]